MIPKYAKRKPPAVRVYPDQREVCTGTAAGKREYFQRTREMAARQDQLCAMETCKQFMVSPTFDHQEGRGMSAAWRDDRIEIDGKWFNAALCWGCNRDKGGRRYHWLNGAYVPQGERHGIEQGNSQEAANSQGSDLSPASVL